MSRSTDILSTYVSDSLALERHLTEAFERQSTDNGVRNYPQAKPLIDKLHGVSREHVEALDTQLRGLGGARRRQSKKP